MTITEGLSPSLPAERVFALEILADPDSAERWVTKTDQADLPGRLRQWATFVADGTPRTEAPYWYDASSAFRRWLDVRDAPSSSSGGAEAANSFPPDPAAAGHEEPDLRRRVANLEGAVRGMLSLLEDVAAFTNADPARYQRLERQAVALRHAIENR
jgi:hypothetical protein